MPQCIYASCLESGLSMQLSSKSLSVSRERTRFYVVWTNLGENRGIDLQVPSTKDPYVAVWINACTNSVQLCRLIQDRNDSKVFKFTLVVDHDLTPHDVRCTYIHSCLQTAGLDQV